MLLYKDIPVDKDEKKYTQVYQWIVETFAICKLMNSQMFN